MSKQLDDVGTDPDPFYDVVYIPIFDARRGRYYRSLNDWINAECRDVNGSVGDANAFRAVLDDVDLFRYVPPVAPETNGVIGVRLWPLEEPAVLAMIEAGAWGLDT